jgi:hypothetical protein
MKAARVEWSCADSVLWAMAVLGAACDLLTSLVGLTGAVTLRCHPETGRGETHLSEATAVRTSPTFPAPRPDLASTRSFKLTRPPSTRTMTGLAMSAYRWAWGGEW